MKVLLTKDVKGLGKVGEVKEVKDGYGRNFIIGRGFGKLATNEVINKWKAGEKKKEVAKQDEITRLKEASKKFEEITVKIVKKLGANGSLFGAITKDEIAHALDEQFKIEIDKKGIDIKNPIKMTGVFEVDVKLGHGVHGTLKIDIMGE